MKTFFRIVAFLEGVSYILLMSVGLYFKYQLGDPSYVKLLGMPHGLLFISYIILAF
jgi:integral membrane protein